MRCCALGACSAAQPRRSLVVVCAAKRGGGGGGRQRQRGGGGKQSRPDKPPAGQSAGRSKTLAMTEFKADEILMFDPVPAARDALQARPPGQGLG